LDDENLIPLSSEEIDDLDAAVIRFVVDTLQPLIIVESFSFRNLFTKSGINYIPMSRPTLKSRLENIYETNKTQVNF
jgi:hypothetical protein